MKAEEMTEDPALISDFVAQAMPLVEKMSKGGAAITTDLLIRSGLPPAAAAEVLLELRRVRDF